MGKYIDFDIPRFFGNYTTPSECKPEATEKKLREVAARGLSQILQFSRSHVEPLNYSSAGISSSEATERLASEGLLTPPKDSLISPFSIAACASTIVANGLFASGMEHKDAHAAGIDMMESVLRMFGEFQVSQFRGDSV